jgi:dTDP-4-dehydrorhamnose reductase
LLAKANNDVSGWLAERKGLYHLAGNGSASRLEWAKEILKLDPKAHEQLTKKLSPAATADFPTPAKRPLFSALDCAKSADVLGLRLPNWQTALSLAMDD